MERVVPAFLAVAFLAGDEDVTGHVETHAVAIHTIKMLHNWGCSEQVNAAIWAAILKRFSYEVSICFALNSYGPILGSASAQFMKEHADELVRHV
jgi:hypothetical protein